MGFRLRPGIFAADVRGDLVFLDAPRDRYFCLPRAKAAGLLGGGTGRGADQGLADELVEEGLLAKGSSGPSFTGCTAEPTAVRDRSRFSLSEPPLGSLLSFGAAALIMAGRMLLQGPEQWLCRPKLRRRVGTLERALGLVKLFDRLRPWIPRSGRCLPSSLLLREFLVLNGIEADLVFGVRTYPFEAHCWVEKDGVVLNDSLEHVRWFTPIAVGRY